MPLKKIKRLFIYYFFLQIIPGANYFIIFNPFQPQDKLFIYFFI